MFLELRRTLKFGEFAEFRDSNKENENVDHLGCFFCTFPRSTAGSQRSALQKLCRRSSHESEWGSGVVRAASRSFKIEGQVRYKS
jgi:hypothetical protein